MRGTSVKLRRQSGVKSRGFGLFKKKRASRESEGLPVRALSNPSIERMSKGLRPSVTAHVKR
jgi:hypothetical protein